MSKYKIHQVYVSAGTTETLAIDYEHTTDELYFWAFPDAHESARDISEGSIESWMNAGKCIAVASGEYKFFGAFDCGYTVFVARKSDTKTKPKQKLYQSFPLSTLILSIEELIKRVEEDAVEILRAIRTPEADGKMILPTKQARAGKVLGFDEQGNPAVGEGCSQLSELMKSKDDCNKYVEEAKRYAKESKDQAAVSGKMAEESDKSAIDSEDWSEKSREYSNAALASLQRVSDEVNKGVLRISKIYEEFNSVLNGALIDTEAEVKALAEQARLDAESISQIRDTILEQQAALSDAQCFICCALKKTESNKNKVAELTSEVLQAEERFNLDLNGILPILNNLNLQTLFENDESSVINVFRGRIFLTPTTNDGHRSGFQLSDFSSRIFAIAPDNSMNGFLAECIDGQARNRVFGGPLQLAYDAQNNDEAVSLRQLDDKIQPILLKFGDYLGLSGGSITGDMLLDTVNGNPPEIRYLNYGDGDYGTVISKYSISSKKGIFNSIKPNGGALPDEGEIFIPTRRIGTMALVEDLIPISEKVLSNEAGLAQKADFTVVQALTDRVKALEDRLGA